ncbi:MAG TPA: hypothetical protein VG406_22150 [Isosphaeraceae bacterium]|jgi:hypothetical protein|nr:hypothetical protein [Isosphaeraceae bacterium]
MPVSFWLCSLWAQATPAAPAQPAGAARLLAILRNYLYGIGEPSITINAQLPWPLGFVEVGPALTWLKVVGLMALLGWAGAWMVTAIKERTVPKEMNIAGLVAIFGSIAAVLVLMGQAEQKAQTLPTALLRVVSVLAWAFRLAMIVWAEWALWSAVRGYGKAADRWTLVGVHLAFAFGVGAGYVVQPLMIEMARQYKVQAPSPLISGVRMAGTFMGFVVLARVVGLLVGEVVAIRWRRIYSIAWHTVVESYRRMWAPWVLIAVFVVILAFTDWFLHAPRGREAELGRLFVGSLSLLISLLLTAMVTILTPISLPNDIQQQTIYTVVSKPVRRLELIWGRMLGFMALVTALLVLFGGLSLIYLERTINKTIAATDAAAAAEARLGHVPRADQLREEANQLRARKSARVPVKGLLSFIDSQGIPRIKGIDVGQELESRSFVEGATQSEAIWTFGVVPDPHFRGVILDRRVPVDLLLRSGTVEDIQNQAAVLQMRAAAIKARLAQPDGGGSGARGLATERDRLLEQAKPIAQKAEALRQQADDVLAQARAAAAAGAKDKARDFLKRYDELHSPPIPVEMTFNVFRTTKGAVIGEAVFASLKVSNPNDLLKPPFLKIFPVHEYYTDRLYFPASYLVGSNGNLKIEVQCQSATQYLGMAESDLYVLASRGSFEVNYIKGLAGIWLQAMVLTAIGVFAGTFLSWPVALLTTVFFFLAGQVAFTFLQDFAMQATPLGGGPFESLIRLVTHANLMTELAPTPAVITAKTLDALVMPVMSRLVFVVPNFSALDVSNTVADGFAVDNGLLMGNILMGLAYALPFSVAAYFILKNREVAA